MSMKIISHSIYFQGKFHIAEPNWTGISTFKCMLYHFGIEAYSVFKFFVFSSDFCIEFRVTFFSLFDASFAFFIHSLPFLLRVLYFRFLLTISLLICFYR